MLRSPLRQWPEATITDPDRASRTEVDKVRKRGWAVAPGEVLSGINALAAPVFDAGGELGRDHRHAGIHAARGCAPGADVDCGGAARRRRFLTAARIPPG